MRFTVAVDPPPGFAHTGPMTTPEPLLTSLAHGGGCGCKLSPGVLRDILAGTPQGGVFADLMVGTETSDDAAVWRLNDDQALVATTDFFMPVVDDPFDFGRIAATNALSDVYAMGGRPILALALVGMPVNVLSVETIGRILAGGASVCAQAGIPVAGGHSIDSVEPIYGLVALGLVHPDRVMTNRGARAGDVLILTKGLGVGVLSAALKQGRLDAAGYATLIASTTQLNAIGADLAGMEGVHAMTDVTGFGLLGHALEMARGSGLGVEIETGGMPLLQGVEAMARDGVRTGASGRNWASYGEAITLPEGFEDWRRDLLTDPQTSGGLLIAVAEEAAGAMLARVRAAGFEHAARVGRLVEGSGVRVV
jgi:selenide,water dikinase